jgi:WD40 repeat protein
MVTILVGLIVLALSVVIVAVLAPSPYLLQTISTDTDTPIIAFNAGGTLLATEGSQGAIELYTVPHGQHVHTLSGHKQRVSACAFHPHKQQLVSSGGDRLIRLWDVQHGTLIRLIDPTLTRTFDSIRSVVFSPDGNLLAASNNYGTIWVWDSQNGMHMQTFSGHILNNVPRAVVSLSFSSDGHMLASAGADGSVSVWSIERGLLLAQLRIPGNSAKINKVLFLQDGSTLISGSDDGAIRLWSLAAEQPIRTLVNRSEPVFAIAVHPHGHFIAWGGGKIYDPDILPEFGPRDTRIAVQMIVPSSVEPMSFLQGHRDNILHLAFSPNGSLLASASRDGTVRLWRVPEFEE